MDWEMLSAIGSLVGGIATAGALGYAAHEYRNARSIQRDAREREVKGVAASWTTVESPDHPDADGRGLWVIDFYVGNPGGLPIEDIHADIHFTTPVSRRRYSGRTEPATSTLTLYAPVIVGHGHRRWTRRLVLDFDAKDAMDSAYAIVAFRAFDGSEHANRWPRSDARNDMSGRP